MDETSGNSDLYRFVVPPKSSRVGNFFEGALTPWVGLRVLIARPRLWKHAIIPVLVNLAIMAAAIFAMIAIGSGLMALLWWALGGEWNQGWWLVAKIAIIIVGALSTLMVCIAAAVIVWRLLSTMFCGYFYGRIATAVEEELGLKPNEMQAISMWREMRDAFYDMGWLIVSLLLSLLISLVPFIGAPVALAYSLYFQVITCGRDQLSYPLSLRGKHRRQRAEFCDHHLPHVIGLGSVVLLMEFIPIFGALFMVTAAAGAVILHRRLALNVHEGESARLQGH